MGVGDWPGRLSDTDATGGMENGAVEGQKTGEPGGTVPFVGVAFGLTPALEVPLSHGPDPAVFADCRGRAALVVIPAPNGTVPETAR